MQTQPQISILIAAMKEERTIGKMITSLLDGYQGQVEILVSIPDEPTYQTLTAAVSGDSRVLRVWRSEVRDPIGKPGELNILMDEAKGSFWIFGDGDTYFGSNVINKLLQEFKNSQVVAVTGRPKSADQINNNFAYFGHLLADAAHHKRNIDLLGINSKIVNRRPFFPVSGYLYALRPTEIRFPQDCLVDDAYISYALHNQGGAISYAPEAEVFVYYPKHLNDYLKQKKRSVGGYIQLWNYGVVSKKNESRSLRAELEYFWFPIKYAQNLKQLWWSLQLYPLRLWLWLAIFWEQKILRKDFKRTWVRIESTK